MKIRNLKIYFTNPEKCFIPKCKAHCCTNAPLPEDYLPKHADKIQRNIYSGINIGQNDPCDTFNSVIYNTTTNPIQLIGIDDATGKKIVGIPPELMEKLQIKSMEQIQALMAKYNQFDNYCPLITSDARCSVYETRPQICKDFGSAPGPENICPEKSSRLEIIKYNIKYYYEYQKEVLKLMWKLMTGKNIINFD